MTPVRVHTHPRGLAETAAAASGSADLDRLAPRGLTRMILGGSTGLQDRLGRGARARSLAVTLIATCGCASQEPEHGSAAPPPLVPSPLDPDGAVVYRVLPGQTLGAIAEACHVPGGAARIAAWNRLEDADHVEAGRVLLLPADTPCPTKLPPAVPPRFTEPWRACAISWKPFAPRNDVPWLDVTRAEAAGALEIDGFEDFLRAERLCADPADGLEVCWRGEHGPGLEVRYQGLTTYLATRTYGVGGANGDVPRYAEHDLDADGDTEIVVTQLTGWSNGFALPWTRVLVLEEPASVPFALSTALYREDGWAAREDGGCDLLGVYTVDLEDPLVGTGNYLAGLRLRWTGTELAQAAEPAFPVVRLTERFLEERFSYDVPVASWLHDGNAEARPASDGPPIETWREHPDPRAP